MVLLFTIWKYILVLLKLTGVMVTNKMDAVFSSNVRNVEIKVLIGCFLVDSALIGTWNICTDIKRYYSSEVKEKLMP